jgi:hypothetical protein
LVFFRSPHGSFGSSTYFVSWEYGSIPCC